MLFVAELVRLWVFSLRVVVGADCCSCGCLGDLLAGRCDVLYSSSEIACVLSLGRVLGSGVEATHSRRDLVHFFRRGSDVLPFAYCRGLYLVVNCTSGFGQKHSAFSGLESAILSNQLPAQIKNL